MKIVSWNINGVRAALGRGLEAFLAESAADIVCLQEVKARREQVPCEFTGWHLAWNAAERPGYSGTATLSRSAPLSVAYGIGTPALESADTRGTRQPQRIFAPFRFEFPAGIGGSNTCREFGAKWHQKAKADDVRLSCLHSLNTEGRVITSEYDSFFLVNVYVPNAGQELERLGYRASAWGPAFRAYVAALAEKKPVVFCGDMNVAVEEIDIARPKQNVGSAGFTPEERQDFRELLAAGFVDTFRVFEKGGGHYTWWSYRGGARQRNVGWRIDYVCISPALLPSLAEAFIWPHVQGSDHCPVGVIFKN